VIIRTLFFLFAAAAILTGGFVYLLFRPTSLLMFKWLDALAAWRWVESLRHAAIGAEQLIPNWVIYSLPFALWVFSYLLFIELIWGNSEPSARLIWYWTVPLIAVLTEFMQIFHVISGTFDWLDLLLILVAVVSVHILTKNHPPKTKEISI
jgi:hypothetical protein